jgi:hypothetical protein
MTSPVITIESSDLDRAAALMVEHRIRHLPITVTQKGQRDAAVVGIISMRDIFTFFVEKEGKQVVVNPFGKKEQQTKIQVNVVTQESNLAKFLIKVVQMALSVEARLIDIQDTTARTEDILIVDLDYIPIPTWIQFVKAQKASQLKLVIILFNPVLQDKKIVQILEQVGKSKKFLALKKPINVFNLHEVLRSVTATK